MKLSMDHCAGNADADDQACGTCPIIFHVWCHHEKRDQDHFHLYSGLSHMGIKGAGGGGDPW